MSQTNDQVRPSEDFNYYRGDIYWNNFDAVNVHHNRIITGRPHVGWQQYTRERYGVAKKGLFVHCGNGWVERDCFRSGLIESVVGTDISEDLIATARTKAQEAGLPAQYQTADTNKFDFSTLEFDWAFNHAAFHHIAHIDAAVRSIWRAMPVEGFLVAYDYTGPHRNQYPWESWSAMVELNGALPQKYRVDLRYPHLRTMLATDPTEAIHSELILEVCRRYFDFQEIRPLGGGIAYQLLYNSKALHADQHTPDGAEIISRIIQADSAYTANSAERSFFNYWVAAPKPVRALDPTLLDRWSLEEEKRELAARRMGQRYGTPEALELIYNEIADLRWRIDTANH
jgi:ubiquinone/menaquinone biosynthesis C-methylase UbiE